MAGNRCVDALLLPCVCCPFFSLGRTFMLMTKSKPFERTCPWGGGAVFVFFVCDPPSPSPPRALL